MTTEKTMKKKIAVLLQTMPKPLLAISMKLPTSLQNCARSTVIEQHSTFARMPCEV
jgi:hypothetical protein